MKDRGVTTYTLIYKNGFSAYTITNLKRNKSIYYEYLRKAMHSSEMLPQ